MNDKAVFSNYYDNSVIQNEDKPKFRNRILKFLEDFVQIYSPESANKRCRSELGITIKKINRGRHAHDFYYCVEETLSDEKISVILDFITIAYDTASSGGTLSGVHETRFHAYIPEVNRILREESMCYVVNDEGRVRYYPDEEFYKGMKATITLLNAPQYKDNLKLFNDVLNEIYKNINKESPIHEFFKCIEILTLSMIRDKNFKLLNDSLVDTLMSKIKEKIQHDETYGEHDIEAMEYIRGMFLKWVKACHKYRHGKADQVNKAVPPELFNLILSTGIAIYRYLLEIDIKYNFQSIN